MILSRKLQLSCVNIGLATTVVIANPCFFVFHQVIVLPGIPFGLDSLNNLLIQKNEVISDIQVIVVVAKQPVMELQVLVYFFKEVCQRIRLIVLIDLL